MMPVVTYLLIISRQQTAAMRDFIFRIKIRFKPSFGVTLKSSPPLQSLVDNSPTV